jgi:Ca2+-binding EF-hand superfamily protein
MSDFWLQKMRTYFQRIDFDHDGKITRSDFEGMANKFAASGKLSEAHSKDLMTTLTAVRGAHLSPPT